MEGIGGGGWYVVVARSSSGAAELVMPSSARDAPTANAASTRPIV